jgi:hypothetical protein
MTTVLYNTVLPTVEAQEKEREKREGRRECSVLLQGQWRIEESLYN